MAFLNTTTTAPSLFDRVHAAANTLIARIAKYRMYRKTLNELSGLNARELDDLGLSRGDLHRVARESSNI